MIFETHLKEIEKLQLLPSSLQIFILNLSASDTTLPWIEIYKEKQNNFPLMHGVLSNLIENWNLLRRFTQHNLDKFENQMRA